MKLKPKEKELLLQNPAIAHVHQYLASEYGKRTATRYLKVMASDLVVESYEASELSLLPEPKTVIFPESDKWVEDVRRLCQKNSFAAIARLCGVKERSLWVWLNTRKGKVSKRSSVAMQVYTAWQHGIKVS